MFWFSGVLNYLVCLFLGFLIFFYCDLKNGMCCLEYGML